MSANAIFASLPAPRAWLLGLLAAAGILLPAAEIWAGESEDAEMAVAKLVHPLEKAGYDFRADVWERELRPDLGKAVRLQLFKGNEYAFWLGTASDGCELELAVYDAKGQPVHMERKADKHTVSVRVNPPHTGTYTVVFSVKSKKERGVTWALAYGYR